VSDYSVTKLDEIEEITDGRVPWRPVRHHLGIQSFGINAYTGANTGDRIINEHDEADEHDRQEELYIVHRGRARFELDGEQVDAPSGTLVYAKPGVKRTAFAEEPKTTLIALGGVPGKPYEAGGWEVWMPFQKLYNEGKYDEAADQARPAIEANPEYAGPLYNLACVESLAGRKDDAITHLRMAVERSDQFRPMAAEDADFDRIREEPAFRELVGT
jgi:mannose-6-phosphate isomerase-like protein (cupin superfamily)